MQTDDIIAAVATAPGMGAIAVIRVSGRGAIETVQQLFFKHIKTQDRSAAPVPYPLTGARAYSMHYGDLYHQGDLMDEVIISVFRAPHSYTGEDTVEIACHGAVPVQQLILKALAGCGVRMAGPGEFSMRAFLNGKMDLAEAEGVADLIAAQSDASRRVALQQMRGGFSAELQTLRSQLLRFVSLIELELDFSEEDVEFADRTALRKLVNDIDLALSKLIASFDYGNVLKNGIPTVIAGHTNVGKSTLLNVLLHEDRAIVSDRDGTTRDVIEACFTLQGHLFRFIDTAGLRRTDDDIERMGIERTLNKIGQARVILLVTDAALPASEWTAQAATIRQHAPHAAIVLLPNKCDRLPADLLQTRLAEAAGLLQAAGFAPDELSIVPISARCQTGIDRLEQRLVDLVRSWAGGDQTVVTNLRHQQALTAARCALQPVRDGLVNGLSGELLSEDIREVIALLSGITGEISSEEVLGEIFGKFCIGK